MARVLILGGGFGGVAAAHRLRQLRPDDEVILVDRGTHFMMGFRKTTAIVGRAPLDEGRRPLKGLERLGVQVRQGTIEAIEPGARAAVVDGERIEADALLVALGAALAPQAVPGLAEHGINVYDPAEAPRAAEALAALDKGKVVVGIFGAPYKCPAAPFELALLANDAAMERDARQRFTVVSPLPGSLPVAGKAACDALEGRLAGMGIQFRASSKPVGVEAGQVLIEGGDAVPFDVLLAVPPHRCPAVVVESGLAEQGAYVKVNPRTLETAFEGVWAVGDVTMIPMANGQPMPKAGAFAEGEGIVAAERIAARLEGRDADAAFEGAGACFLEVGGGEAMLVKGRFLAEPAPEVELTVPSAEQLEEKHAWERERLDAWFGAPA